MYTEIMKGPRLQLLHAALQSGDSLVIEGLWNAPKALIAAMACEATGKHLLLLTGASQRNASFP